MQEHAPLLTREESSSPWQDWQDQFHALADRLAPRFARTEAREVARSYLEALLSPVERKNGWQMAESLGMPTPYSLQHLLGRARWQADEVRDDLQQFVQEQLGEEDGVFVVDETGFVKKGNQSAGVGRQYSGTAGRIENCQIGVFLGYASRKGTALIDRRLYLPQEWIEDKERRKKAGIPQETERVTKPKLAKAMLEHAFAAGMPGQWVTGDSVYGNDRSLQFWLQEQRKSHVLAVTGQEMVYIGFESFRIKELLQAVREVPEDTWQILSSGKGAKGERLYAWFWQEINCLFSPEWKRWVLVRRSLAPVKDPAQGPELTAYIAFAPSDTPLSKLVAVAGSRWSIECCFEMAKGEVGLDQYEVRSWVGWYRHVTLSMVALAFLSALRASEQEPQEQGRESGEGKKGAARLLATRPPLPPLLRDSMSPFKKRRGLLSV